MPRKHVDELPWVMGEDWMKEYEKEHGPWNDDARHVYLHDPEDLEEYPLDPENDPCPIRCISDAGSGFSLGLFGGGLWHSIQGYRNSPKGEKVLGAMLAVKSRAPVIGGNFAVWSAMFSFWDCTFAGVRRKTDMLNPIMSGFMTGGFLAARGGFRNAMRSAVVGGILLTFIEVAAFGFSSFGGMPSWEEIDWTGEKAAEEAARIAAAGGGVAGGGVEEEPPPPKIIKIDPFGWLPKDEDDLD